ncbi:SusD/RagB family nutrient-binding outer membrane lipoprotein [Portibacter lacus]|uniref:SusD/RagB family nutrient-binding outer membrane lipoprotein n=1 Tax=Portibacter lacus TaxID=1099794 RepID=A0AA37SWX0_9BACT|nr:SusD/RagB family nutrient-binding outer membrane lipoprotein [Portibacter lacus]GLR19428.1 hypothetical protein GCM10007940_40440 [Portibacter lacus]
MKFYIKSLYLFCAVAVLASCGDFGDLNVNPNAPTKVGTETLLTSAQRTVSSAVGAVSPELFVQHMSEITYTEGSRYQDVIADFNGWYTGALANLQHIIDLNENPETAGEVLSGGSNANQIGVARIMKAYYFDILVQRWGPVPYSEALKGGSNLGPAYDSEASIYADLFKELEEAAAQLGSGAVAGDIILGGDTDEWKLFANTLRAKIALRLSDVDEGTAKAQFTSAVNAGIFDRTVVYQYLEETANQNPWYGRFVTRQDFAISNTLYDFMIATNDDRLVNFADPANSSGEIVAMPYGLENSDVAPADVSFPNSTYVRAQGVGIPIFSLAQIEFMLAEAAARGWISDDAEAHYNAAIAASMNQWGIDDQDAIDKFIAQDNVAYDAANWKESIGLQKWVALYNQGYDAWVNWRKLDFPVLQPAENPLNVSEQIPLRNMYPESEATVNEENYKAILSTFGGADSDGIRLYWDVN